MRELLRTAAMMGAAVCIFVLQGCSVVGGVMLNIDPVGWCMGQHTAGSKEDWKKYCEGEFMATRRNAKQQARALDAEEQRKFDQSSTGRALNAANRTLETQLGGAQGASNSSPTVSSGGWASRSAADLQAIASSRGSVATPSPASSGTNATPGGSSPEGLSGNCQARVDAHERQVAQITKALPPDQIRQFQAVMWATSTRIELLNQHCPTSAATRKLQKELQDAYDGAERACNSVSTVKCRPVV